MIDDEDYVEGDENSEPATTAEEFAEMQCVFRRNREISRLLYWTFVPGTDLAIGHHGQIARLAGDELIADESKAAQTMVHAWLFPSKATP